MNLDMDRHRKSNSSMLPVKVRHRQLGDALEEKMRVLHR